MIANSDTPDKPTTQGHSQSPKVRVSRAFLSHLDRLADAHGLTRAEATTHILHCLEVERNQRSHGVPGGQHLVDAIDACRAAGHEDTASAVSILLPLIDVIGARRAKKHLSRMLEAARDGGLAEVME